MRNPRPTCRAIAIIAAAALAGCSASDSSNPVFAQNNSVLGVTVAPSSATVPLGGSERFTADVKVSEPVSRAVHWSLVPPLASFSVDDSGVVRACYPGGSTNLVATSVADPTVSGTAALTTPPSTAPAPAISSVTRAGTDDPIALDSLTGVVDVKAGLNADLEPCFPLEAADLVITRASGDTVVDEERFTGAGTGATPATVTFRSDTVVNGVRVFPNGAYAMRLDARYSGSSEPVGTGVVPFTIRNP